MTLSNPNKIKPIGIDNRLKPNESRRDTNKNPSIQSSLRQMRQTATSLEDAANSARQKAITGWQSVKTTARQQNDELLNPYGSRHTQTSQLSDQTNAAREARLQSIASPYNTNATSGLGDSFAVTMTPSASVPMPSMPKLASGQIPAFSGRTNISQPTQADKAFAADTEAQRASQLAAHKRYGITSNPTQVMTRFAGINARMASGELSRSEGEKLLQAAYARRAAIGQSIPGTLEIDTSPGSAFSIELAKRQQRRDVVSNRQAAAAARAQGQQRHAIIADLARLAFMGNKNAADMLVRMQSAPSEIETRHTQAPQQPQVVEDTVQQAAPSPLSPDVEGLVRALRSGKPPRETIDAFNAANTASNLLASGPDGQKLLALPKTRLTPQSDGVSRAEEFLDRLNSVFRYTDNPDSLPPANLVRLSASLENVSDSDLHRYQEELRRTLPTAIKGKDDPRRQDYIKLQLLKDILDAESYEPTVTSP